jgi:hypothetical protein
MTPALACFRLAVMAVALDRSPLGLRVALYHINRGIHHANKNGDPKSQLFRSLNWLRAELRRVA